MEILFITATLPYPPTDGAKIRLFSLIKNLSQRHKISVASFVTPVDSRNAVDHLRSYCKEVQVVPRKARYPVSKILWGLVSKTPFTILNYWDAAMAAVVRRMVESTAFDIVQAEALQAAQYCSEIRGCKVLDLFDIQSVVMQRYANQQSDRFKRAYAEMTAQKLAQYELDVCPYFSQCLTASIDDQRFVEHVGFSHVSIVPNGVDLDTYIPMTDEQRVVNNRVVFVGRMDYTANDDGIRWFCQEVLPIVRAHRPDILLQIVGKSPTKEVQKLVDPGCVEVTGFVDDVRPFLEAATACIVPLRVGGGTRLKILEAFAMQKAVVSTSVGAEGLAVTPERDLLIADDPDRFAKQVIRVLEDPELRRSLGRSGRQLAEKYYGWNMISQQLEEVYEGALQRLNSSPSLPSKCY